MDDLAKWRHPDHCVEVLISGVNFLYDMLEARHRGSNLAARIRALGDLSLRLDRRSGGNPLSVDGSDPEAQQFVRELNTLGTMGYGLWHLRRYLDSQGFRYEMQELARLGTGPAKGNDERERGQGFLLYTTGVLAVTVQVPGLPEPRSWGISLGPRGSATGPVSDRERPLAHHRGPSSEARRSGGGESAPADRDRSTSRAAGVELRQLLEAAIVGPDRKAAFEAAPAEGSETKAGRATRA